MEPVDGRVRALLRQVTVFEAQLGIPSGIGPMVSDECQIDPATFETFVNTLLGLHRARWHPVMTALSEGFVATTVVLAERMRIETSAPEHLQARAQELSRSMGV